MLLIKWSPFSFQVMIYMTKKCGADRWCCFKTELTIYPTDIKITFYKYRCKTGQPQLEAFAMYR